MEKTTHLCGVGEEYTVDLSVLENKPLNENLFKKGINEFDFTLPASKIDITFKLLTGADEKKINNELEGLKKINKDSSPELSTSFKIYYNISKRQ